MKFKPQVLRALAVFIACVAAQAAQAQQVYKCQGANGQAVFQQHPCHDGKGAAVEVRSTNTVEGNPSGDAGVRAQAARAAAVSTALARGQVLEGMSSAELRQVLGQPSMVNTDIVNGRVSRQHVYRYSDGSTRYVYTNDSGVYALQDRPAAAQPSPQPCYSDLDIRNAEVGATSVTLPANERAQRRARADQMRRCRR